MHELICKSQHYQTEVSTNSKHNGQTNNKVYTVQLLVPYKKK